MFVMLLSMETVKDMGGRPLVTRFAPSPTGKLHIGSVRTALYCWLLARQHDNGIYILRIEDTDVARSTKVFEANMIEGLSWMWLPWDGGPGVDHGEGPYYQMERLPIYQRYLADLLDGWVAYYAWETPEELDAMREDATAQKKPFHYRRIAYTQEELDQFVAQWRTPVVRFEVPQWRVLTFNDKVKGEVSTKTDEIGDFVIMKSDGVPTYHFAVVVDDITMNVTHVVRGEDHLANTPKHILLYEAFGAQGDALPVFAHLPLMLRPGGGKMSKRDENIGLVLVDQFQEAWFLPEAVLNFVALLGWNPGTDQEFFTLDELIATFSLERVQSSNAMYDFKRALRFNSEYIKRLSDEAFVDRLQAYLRTYGGEIWRDILATTDRQVWLCCAPQIKVRLQTFGQFKDHCQYFFIPPAQVDDALVCREKMQVTPTLLHDHLSSLFTLLSSIAEQDWHEVTLQEQLLGYVREHGLKNGQILRPLRAILTGAEASPGAFEMLALLGKDESMLRLRSYISAISGS
jgi:nondiscriminating glutamyl-tRNA synthetase